MFVIVVVIGCCTSARKTRLKIKPQEGVCAAPAPKCIRFFEKCNFFPTCQVRVVRFYVSLLVLLLLLFFLRRRAVSPQASTASAFLPRRRAVSSLPRAAMSSVACRTSTATICAQCSLPDLNRDHLRSVFPAGPQLRPSALNVPCRTSAATICAQCSLPDLSRDHLSSVFPAGS